MSTLYKIAFSAMLGVFLLAACEKAEELPFYEAGSAPVLSASATAIAPAPADSNKVVLNLNWSSPNYATDTANYKFVVEVAPAGTNFAAPLSKTIAGARTVSYLAKELNTALLDKFGYLINQTVNLEARVISSYSNNNERQISNVVPMKATTYKVPPKVPLPVTGELFLVGDASQGGWNNPVPTPSQQFTRIDETTFGGVFKLNGGKEYLILPKNGDWGNKFSVANKGAAGINAGGAFGFNLSDNFPAPATDGDYKIILDFQLGTFTVTPFDQQHGLIAELYLVGGASPGGWNNPVPVPSQQFTRVNATQFTLGPIALKAGEKYLLLPENGSWAKKFGALDPGAPGVGNGGTLKPEGGDIPAPAESGNYTITVDFINNSFKVTKQ